jgi:hypothetical protein
MYVCMSVGVAPRGVVYMASVEHVPCCVVFSNGGGLPQTGMHACISVGVAPRGAVSMASSKHALMQLCWRQQACKCWQSTSVVGGFGAGHMSRDCGQLVV